MYPNLRIQLWKSGIRQNRLAKMLDMDETLLSRIVNGFRQASPDCRKRISALLQSEEDWLFQVENASPEPLREPRTESSGQRQEP